LQNDNHLKNFLLVLLLVPFSVKSQKEAVITIWLPHTVNKQQVGISYHNGKDRKFVDVTGNSDSIVIRDTYYSQHLVLFMHYKGAKPGQGYGVVFYVNDRPATIQLAVNEPLKNIFSNVQVNNAVNATSLGFEQMYQYVSKEQEQINTAYDKMMVSPEKEAIRDTLRFIVQRQYEKKLQYIRNHLKQYYSFYIFSLEYINLQQFPVDSLISIFNSFPPGFKNCFEGKQTLAFLNIRKLREQKRQAPDFSFKDIEGKMISLSEYKGRYVVINFWASWCVPCVMEFPELNRLTADITEEKLVRIFVTEDSDTLAFNNARIKYDLKGIHMFANSELITKYKADAVPQLYLIDKEGKILYDRGALKDYKLEALANVIKKTPDLQ
jgi:thiol-disulfide isomerase/thioredoxin